MSFVDYEYRPGCACGTLPSQDRPGSFFKEVLVRNHGDVGLDGSESSQLVRAYVEPLSLSCMRRARAGSPPSRRGAYRRGRPPSFPDRSSPPPPDNDDPCRSDRLSARVPAALGEKNRMRRNLRVAQDYILTEYFRTEEFFLDGDPGHETLAVEEGGRCLRYPVPVLGARVDAEDVNEACYRPDKREVLYRYGLGTHLLGVVVHQGNRTQGLPRRSVRNGRRRRDVEVDVYRIHTGFLRQIEDDLVSHPDLAEELSHCPIPSLNHAFEDAFD